MDETPMLRADAVTIRALREMPLGRPLRFDIIKDMDGNDRRVIVWTWIDRGTLQYPLIGHRRTASFDPETGEYLGEA